MLSSIQLDSSNSFVVLADLCKPMTSIMRGLPPETTTKIVFDLSGGLSGSEVLKHYPCLFEERSARFFVWLGDADFAYFTRSTFMNLCNFAEGAGARTITFLVYHEHR